MCSVQIVFFCLTFFPVNFFVFGLLFFCVYVHHGMIFGKKFIFSVFCVKIVVYHFFLRLLSLHYSRYFLIFSVLQCFCSSWDVALTEVYVKNMKMLCFFSVFLFILVCLMFILVSMKMLWIVIFLCSVLRLFFFRSLFSFWF